MIAAPVPYLRDSVLKAAFSALTCWAFIYRRCAAGAGNVWGYCQMNFLRLLLEIDTPTWLGHGFAGFFGAGAFVASDVHRGDGIVVCFAGGDRTVAI